LVSKFVEVKVSLASHSCLIVVSSSS